MTSPDGSFWRGVILDVDGTLVDSNDAHARAWVNAFGEEGLDVPYDKVRPLIGMGGDQLVPQVIGKIEDEALFERLKTQWERHFTGDELPYLEPQPGARDFVEALLARGLKVVLGTSSEQSMIDALLEKAGLEGMDLPATTASDVKASKPQPDIAQAALTKLALPPEEVLMVGDTPYDVTAANRAGVRTVALRCGGFEDFGDALAIYRDPADFAAHLRDVFGPS